MANDGEDEDLEELAVIADIGNLLQTAKEEDSDVDVDGLLPGACSSVAPKGISIGKGTLGVKIFSVLMGRTCALASSI
jgi:hypothetical protein